MTSDIHIIFSALHKIVIFLSAVSGSFQGYSSKVQPTGVQYNSKQVHFRVRPFVHTVEYSNTIATGKIVLLLLILKAQKVIITS